MVVHVSEFVVGVWDGLDECEISQPEILSQSAPAFHFETWRRERKGRQR